MYFASPPKYSWKFLGFPAPLTVHTCGQGCEKRDDTIKDVNFANLHFDKEVIKIECFLPRQEWREIARRMIVSTINPCVPRVSVAFALCFNNPETRLRERYESAKMHKTAGNMVKAWYLVGETNLRASLILIRIEDINLQRGIRNLPGACRYSTNIKPRFILNRCINKNLQSAASTSAMFKNTKILQEKNFTRAEGAQSGEDFTVSRNAKLYIITRCRAKRWHNCNY